MYKGQAGMWAWLLHRITGIGILLFLLVHIVDVSLLGFGPAVYNDGIRLFDFWVTRLLSLALIAAVLFHAFNGIRVLLIDFTRRGGHYQRALFALAFVLAVVCFIPMALFVVVPLVHLFATASTK